MITPRVLPLQMPFVDDKGAMHPTWQKVFTQQIIPALARNLGTATLSAGSVVVPNKSIQPNSHIQLTMQTPGGTPGFLSVSHVVSGVSFTINSTSKTDQSVVAYNIIQP